MQPPPFWMVLADNKRETSVRHISPANARREAERLALKHPGTRFFVMEVIGAAQTPVVQWADYAAHPGDIDVPY